MSTYNRYSSFIKDGAYTKVPFIEIATASSDVYEYYEPNKSRLDLLSYQYYDDANYGWLILQANPTIGSLEFKIDSMTQIRVPYPLDSALQRYQSAVTNYIKLYGLN